MTLPSTPHATATTKFISPLAAQYPAGGITSSLGTGTIDDSSAISATIPAYPRLSRPSSSHWMKLSSIEAVLSDERHEARVAQRRGADAGVRPADQGKCLRTLGAQGDDHAAPRLELLDERRRHLGPSGGDQDGVEGRIRAPAQRSVPH